MGKWTGKRILIVTAAVVVGIPLLLVAIVVGWLTLFFYGGAFYSGDGDYRKYDGRIEPTFRAEFPPIDLTTRSRHQWEWWRNLATISGSALVYLANRFVARRLGRSDSTLPRASALAFGSAVTIAGLVGSVYRHHKAVHVARPNSALQADFGPPLGTITSRFLRGPKPLNWER